MPSLAEGEDSVKMCAKLLRAIADMIETDRKLARKLSARLKPSARARKQKRVLDWDVFQIFAEKGEQGLLEFLNKLDLVQLKDIVGEHRLDPSGLSLKWRKKERLVKFILDRIISRTRHGEVFLGKEQPSQPPTDR
jgi:hypothetical protein